MKINKDYLIVPIFTVIFLILYMYCSYLSADELWNFSYAYNMANGYLPYKDFNMIITPLYPILVTLFIKLPFNKYLLYMILNAFFAANIIYLTKKQKENYLVTILFLIFLIPFSYNTFIILLYYLLIKFDDNDKLSGIIVALIFLTKQSIGICFFIVMIIFSKNRFKRFIYFLIPNLIFLIYLIGSNTIMDFIDLGFLGLFEFADKNSAFNLDVFIIFVFNIVILLYFTIKSKFKERKYLYLLAIQSISFPIIESYHVFITLIPLLSLLISKIRNNKIIRIVNAVIVILSIYIFISSIHFNNVPNNTKILKYRNIGGQDLIPNIKSFIRENDGYNFIIITNHTTYIKEELELNPTKYDIPLYGNMGINGTNNFINYIDNTCKEKCFIIVDSSNWQINKKVIKYVEDNYKLYSENIYTNN